MASDIDTFHRRSPLADSIGIDHSTALPAEAGVKLREIAPLHHWVIQGASARDAATYAGATFPEQANTVTESDQVQVFWRGPNEWLVVAADETPPDFIAAAATACATEGGAVVDVSAGQTVLAISGAHARSALAKGMTIDLHRRSFSHGQCAQTVLAQASVLVWPSGPSELQIIVRRSFADYLWQWLIDASGEYGCAIID